MDDRLTARQIEVLRDLGLSRAEAEVYLACLALGAGGGGPFSSYRIAQDMGRDPANIGKIFNGLVRLQAVRVVQEGPRLFAVVPPDEFTAQLLGRVRRQGSEAVALLDSFGPPNADGVVLALTSREQAFARARDLLAACRQQALVSGSPDALRELGAELEQAATQPGRRVRVLTPEPMSSAVVEIGQIPPAGQVGQDRAESWLHLVVDGQAWLTALLPAETDGPACCGWWCRGSAVARVLAESLEICWRSAVAVATAPAAPAADQIVVTAPQESATAFETTDDSAFAPGVTAAAPAAAVPEPVGTAPEAHVPSASEPAPAVEAAAASGAAPSPAASDPDTLARTLSADEAERAGFTFLFRHRADPSSPKR
jgi:sugar-specific transcriptional regulator TrmB